jgi:hypothetical protein
MALPPTIRCDTPASAPSSPSPSRVLNEAQVWPCVGGRVTRVPPLVHFQSRLATQHIFVSDKESDLLATFARAEMMRPPPRVQRLP